jgi:predicted DCC family thiol-disulfide oxidoreductase YuxK
MGAPTVFLFDGDCAFCSACASFIQRRIPTDAMVIPWQRADLGRLGLTAAQGRQSVWWIDGERRDAGPVAIAALLRSSHGTGWRMVGRLLGWRPLVAIGWPVYRFVARHGHRLPGGTAACALPGPQPTVNPHTLKTAPSKTAPSKPTKSDEIA